MAISRASVVMENFQFDWKGSLAPRRETGAETVLFVDWKASLIPVRPVEVRNTFVHFEEDEDLLRKASQSRRTASSPPELRTAGTVREEQEPGEIANCAVEPEASDSAADACNVENSEECGTTSCSTDVPEKVAADMTLHQLGQCRPCAYFRMKADGCQKGDACEFCHLCTSEDVRAKQILYKRQVRAQKRAAASQAKHCQS